MSNSIRDNNTIEDFYFLYNEIRRILFSTTDIYNNNIYSDMYDSTDTIINSTLNDESVYKNIISEDGEKELETILYIDNSNQFPIEKCPITFIDFEDGEEVIKLPCNHYFNPYGINKWLREEKAECPVCRYKLNSVEKKIEAQAEQAQAEQAQAEQAQAEQAQAEQAQAEQAQAEQTLSESPQITTTRRTLYNSLSVLNNIQFLPFIETNNDLQYAIYESLNYTSHTN
jgi:hypothetical protein